MPRRQGCQHPRLVSDDVPSEAASEAISARGRGVRCRPGHRTPRRMRRSKEAGLFASEAEPSESGAWSRWHLGRMARGHLNGYRGTSLTRKRTPLGPYRRPMHRVLRG